MALDPGIDHLVPQVDKGQLHILQRSAVSRRDDFLYYYESRLTAVRMGPWKMHFSTREDYYDPLQGRTAPLLFNLRSDPFERPTTTFGHLGQRATWVFQPIVEHVLEHLKTLAEYPPVQGGTSFDMSKPRPGLPAPVEAVEELARSEGAFVLGAAWSPRECSSPSMLGKTT